jgi:TM2 domain-containing membrane protein YozV
MDKVWVIEDPDEYLKPRRTQRITKEIHPLEEKDPALAYTLSLLFWGAGQLYNGQRTKGLSYVCLMLYCIAAALLAIMFDPEIPSYLRFYGISPAQVVLGAACLLCLILIFWVSNASDAYHTAVKARKTPFAGVSSRAYPVLCSLFVPGWGQFLNGQPIKGGLFAGCAVLSVFSLLSVLSILQVWPSLESSDSRLIVEEVLMLSLFLLLPMPALWIFSAFDAWKVSQDDIKKAPLLERLTAANNRRRAQGWVRGVFPQVKTTVLLALLLILLLIFINQYYFPRNFYYRYLVEVQRWSSKQGMVLIPDHISRIMAVLSSMRM